MGNDTLTRRDFWMAGGAALTAAALVPGIAHAEDGDKPDLKDEFLFDMRAQLETPQMLGDTPHGNRMIFVVTGGRIEGPKINADILPSGGDWFRTRSDGVSELDVRATLKTDDGALIYVRYPGLLHTKTPDGSQYFRTTPRFETSSEKYDWLNNLIAVGYGWQPGPNEVSYRVFAIL